MRGTALNALTGFGAAFLVVLAILAGDNGIIATAHATDAENLVIPLPRPRPVIRIPRPRTGRFPGRTQVMEFESYERLFSLWHVLHLPLFFMLLIAGIVHVVAVHVY